MFYVLTHTVIMHLIDFINVQLYLTITQEFTYCFMFFAEHPSVFNPKTIKLNRYANISEKEWMFKDSDLFRD